MNTYINTYVYIFTLFSVQLNVLEPELQVDINPSENISTSVFNTSILLITLGKNHALFTVFSKCPA